MAGLLDYLNAGSGGGILDFLRNSGIGQQMANTGLPSDQAQYGFPFAQTYSQPALARAPVAVDQNPQPSPLDNAQWPQGPASAPSQALAQMPAPQNNQPGPDFIDRISAGLQSIGNGGSILGAVTGNYTDPVTQQRAIQNQTERALVQKGVDPTIARAAVSNPEILKSLAPQVFGPNTLTPLGSGYVADRQGNVRRAYEPDDKIPAGFEKTETGLRPIPGGPADPAYIQLTEAKKKDPNGVYTLGRGGEVVRNNPDGTVTVLHKNQEAGTDAATIDDKTATLLATRVLAGDTKALVGLGRGAQGSANLLKIQKIAADIAEQKGLDARGILANIARQAETVSSARTLGTKATHFGAAEKAMEESLPLAQAASDAMPRGDWLLVNKLIQMGQTQHSNPLLKRFLIATDTAAKDYARTINPTGVLRESDIEYARKILSTADGPESYKAALDQLRLEAQVMHRAIIRQRDELYGKKGGHPDPGKPTGVPAPGSYNWTPDQGLKPAS